MRLFLSSENLGNYPEVFLKLVGKNQKVALIENAKDDLVAIERKKKIKEHLEQFSSLGFRVEEIDLRDYFNDQAELAEKMRQFGGVFVFGGNTFILRRAMAASGFDSVITDLLRVDKIVYGGSSAGSCVAAESLRGIDRGDRPHSDVVPKSYPIKKTIWDGLGLVSFMVVPHYKSTWFEKQADATIAYLKRHKKAYRVLQDGQVILIDGDRKELLA